MLGLILGSFATVVSHRLPRNQRVATGRSRCPSCGKTVTALQNVPVLSYLALRGRCAHCGQRISVRYPLTELAIGILFTASVVRFGVSLQAALYCAFFWALVVLTVIDLEHKLLPNKVVYPAFVIGWVGLAVDAALSGDIGRLGDAGAGALIFGGFFFVIAYIAPAGMGGGDVKLAFVLGTFLGYAGGVGVVLLGMFMSFLLGGVVGIVLILALGKGRKTAVPFGPFLALGTTAAIFFGDRLLDLYLGR